MCTQDVCAPCSFLPCFEKMLLGNLPHISPLSPSSFFFFLYSFWMPDFCHCEEGKVMWKWGRAELAQEDTAIRLPDPILSDPAISLKSVGVSECGSVARLGLWWTAGWRGENGGVGGGLKRKYSCGEIRMHLWWSPAVVGQILQPSFTLMHVEL